MLFNDSKVASKRKIYETSEKFNQTEKNTKKEHFLLLFSLFSHCATVDNIEQKQELKSGIFYFRMSFKICLKFLILLPESYKPSSRLILTRNLLPNFMKKARSLHQFMSLQ